MRRFRSAAVLLLSLNLVLPSPLLAATAGAVTLQQQQRHVVDESELEAALALQAVREALARQTVRRVLSRPEVVEVAETLGLEISDARTAVSALEGEELVRLGEQAELVETGLAGGAVLTITTTTIIIILLLVIILVLIAD